MIYGITDGDEHSLWILTRRLRDYEIFNSLCELTPKTLVVPGERWLDIEINQEKN